MGRDMSIVSKLLWIVGWGIAAVGLIMSLVIMFRLNTYLDFESFYGVELHPLRFVFALGVLASTSVPGLILVGISELIANNLAAQFETDSSKRDLFRNINEINSKLNQQQSSS
ncbi:hypothetical protein MM326_13975 [Alkalihalobacillus sp. LMS6]|uniref:hypothetical protein n=1 Tax=Alkalihalobacillus sp. LMS6 TaxID=2924034 RepID=UPI0020D04500|nr:hypothetical protein [Alkalihalobacillus sp. LMS6]UTR05211.1 hypothetical protein MM326_13975 [Alkalihalobacillus sp. LMS6]